MRAEARAIVRAKAAGVETPAIFLVDVDQIHGDITTSNVLVRNAVSAQAHNDDDIEQASLVLIDFGLARIESTSGAKAIDLYVLERSLLSSHSELPDLFPAILSKYIKNFRDKKQRREIVSKYKEVRACGRDRLMVR